MARGSLLVVIKALSANLGIAVIKFIVAFLSGSAAMTAEAVHSLADSGNQVLLLVGLNRSQRSEDTRHEFGYGSEGYFWAFIVAISLFTMGATFSIYEGVEKILHRDVHMGNPLWAYIVIGASLGLESFSLKSAYDEFQKFRGGRSLRRAIDEVRDASIIVVLFEDSADIAGLLIAGLGILLAQLTGDPLWDGVASITVGVLLAGVATFVAMKTKALLVGEAVTTAERARIIELTTASPGVRKLIHLRTLHLGPEDVIVAMKVAFDDDATTTQIAEYVDGVEERLRSALPHLSRIYIEVGTIAEPKRPQGPHANRADPAQT
jgi:cation diffusion facilitator family transporter